MNYHNGETKYWNLDLDVDSIENDDLEFDKAYVPPFNRASIIDANSKEEKIYSANSMCGGLFMALMMIAREITDFPQAFRHIINAKQKSWIDRKKMFDH